VTAVASLTRVRVVVDHTMPSAHPTAKINKVKDIALIFWSVSLPHQDFILSKTSWASAFLRNFCHSHLFNKMFIVNGYGSVTKKAYFLLPVGGYYFRHNTHGSVASRSSDVAFTKNYMLLYLFYLYCGCVHPSIKVVRLTSSKDNNVSLRNSYNSNTTQNKLIETAHLTL